MFRQTNGHYADFQKIANPSNLLLGIDDAPTINDDHEALYLAQSMWQEIDEGQNDREELLFTFIDYLELIKSKAKGIQIGT